MKIANADKLIHHFENVVDVKLFTVPEIVTIINSFSLDIPDGAQIVMPRHLGQQMVYDNMAKIMNINKPGVTQKVGGDNWLSEVIESTLSEEQISEVNEDD